jgi:hypothetical protein
LRQPGYLPEGKKINLLLSKQGYTIINLMKRIILILLILTLSACSLGPRVYSSKGWSFQINIPRNWQYKEAYQITEEALRLNQPEKARLIEEAGTVVSFSPATPRLLTGKFVPNINIAAKNLEISPVPVNDAETIEYAQKLLATFTASGALSYSRQLRIDEFLGAKAQFKYQLLIGRKTLDVFTAVAILLDRKSYNYFVITLTCLEADKEKYEKIFEQALKTFKKI